MMGHEPIEQALRWRGCRPRGAGDRYGRLCRVRPRARDAARSDAARGENHRVRRGTHLGVIGDRARKAYAQTLEATTSIQVFGMPTENVLRMLRQQAGSVLPLSIYPYHLGGFTRASQR